MTTRPEYDAQQVVAATSNINNLMKERLRIIKDLEATSKRNRWGETPDARQARLEQLHTDAVASLAVLHLRIERERALERDARGKLATANRRLDEELAKKEASAYRQRMPPAGQGPPLLTEADFQRAQNSVPRGRSY